MDRLYECNKSDKSKLEKILGEKPYEKGSFAMIGYTLKDGVDYGFEGKVLLYISADEDIIKSADEKLKDIATPVPDDKAASVIGKLKAEEETAEKGFGAIFG